MNIGNLLAKVALPRLISYVESHPEVLDQVIEALVKALVKWLEEGKITP